MLDADRASAEQTRRLAPPGDPEAIAREICLRLLASRARSRRELETALARRLVPAETAASVLDRFAEVGLVDDAAVADQVVRSRLARGHARRSVVAALRDKGLDDEQVRGAVATISAEDELVAARRLVSARITAMTGLAPDQQARRLVGLLARRGYSAELAHRVVREAVQGAADDDDASLG